MRSERLRSGQWLMLVLLLVPVFVQPKNIKEEKNEWAAGESKDQTGRYDNMVQKGAKKPATAAPDDRSDRAGILVADDPDAIFHPTDASQSSEAAKGSNLWIWAVLGSLCVAGLGLAGLSYYSSRARRASAW